MLWAALNELSSSESEGVSISRLAKHLRNNYRNRNPFPAHKDADELLEEAYRCVNREFMTEENRICLEGVNLAQWVVKFPESFQLPTELFEQPWQLPKGEAVQLASLMLDSMRRDFGGK